MRQCIYSLTTRDLISKASASTLPVVLCLTSFRVCSRLLVNHCKLVFMSHGCQEKHQRQYCHVIHLFVGKCKQVEHHILHCRACTTYGNAAAKSIAVQLQSLRRSSKCLICIKWLM